MCKDNKKFNYVFGSTRETFTSSLNDINYKKKKIAGFDLDMTLIKTKSKKKYSNDPNDWEWCYPNVIDKLVDCHKNDYIIVIVTNQAGIQNSNHNLKIFYEKIQNIHNDIKKRNITIEFDIFVLTHYDNARKPSPLIFYNQMFHFHRDSFFCGDSAGRPSDYSDVDIKFAFNLKIKFMTPEYFFMDDHNSHGNLSYSIVPYDITIINNKYNHVINNQKHDFIILCGLPLSGKSSLSYDIKMTYIINKQQLIIMETIGVLKNNKLISMMNNFMNQKLNILIDSCNTTKKERKMIIDNIDKNKYHITIVCMNTSFDRCMHNNYHKLFVDSNHQLFPKSSIKSLNDNYEKPSLDEGVDNIEYVNQPLPSDYYYLCYF
jgi:DNA 3'-phosphatase